MKGKTILIVTIAVLASTTSAFIGVRAIATTVTSGRAVAMSAEASHGEIESKGDELEQLVTGLDEAGSSEAVASSDRDPMVVYKAPPKPKPVSTKPAPRRPTWPNYKVTAVLIDDDPRAFLDAGGQNITVKIGDEIKGGRIIAIEHDGVTIRGEAGTKKYPF